MAAELRGVWIMFDTGAMGASPLLGLVLREGKKKMRVRWESGIEQWVYPWMVRNDPFEHGFTPEDLKKIAEEAEAECRKEGTCGICHVCQKPNCQEHRLTRIN